MIEVALIVVGIPILLIIAILEALFGRKIIGYELKYPRYRKDGMPDLRYSPIRVPIYETTPEEQEEQHKFEVQKQTEAALETRRTIRAHNRFTEEVMSEVEVVDAAELEVEDCLKVK